MMTDFSALLHGDTVLEGVTASSKKALINQLAAGLAHAHGLEAKAVSATLAAREKLGSTGFGGGIAIPHGKLDGLVQPVGLFARLAEPLDFQAIDELPVDLVFAMLSPPMAGAAWDLAGPWGAFGMMSLWASGAVLCALWLPARVPGQPEAEPAMRTQIRVRDLLPKPADYITAFKLLGAPAVALVVLFGALMHVGNTVQGSFYVAWLKDMGITGTAIGLLSPAAAVAAALFSLVTAWLTRFIGGLWIVLISIWIGVVLICITPLLGSYLLLQIAMFLRSGANGLAQPLIITLVMRGAGRNNQGKAIGLRGTANRVASIVSPLAMGAIAEAVGLAAAFYIVGLAISLALAAVAVWLWRRPDVARSEED